MTDAIRAESSSDPGSPRTKMVCTLGPRSESPEVIGRLIEAGMDVARLNFSHGTHATHGAAFETVRRMAGEMGRNVAVLMDLQGPKIRTGPLEGGGPVYLETGQEVAIVATEAPGTAECLTTSYERLAEDVGPGDRILISDGGIALRVERLEGSKVHTRVIRGGELRENQGINLPGVAVSAPSLTDKDIEDLDFGLSIGVDFVALSFVRNAEDVATLKERIRERGHDTPVVAKIERPEAVLNFEHILDYADAVMVARGDLGVEAELEEVPKIQKDLIRICNERARPVITATQMLESMIVNSRPTRAEVADVANAIYDGTDAVMLSGETAAGRYPVEAARFMARIAATTDRHIAQGGLRPPVQPRPHADFGQAIGEAAFHISDSLKARRIVCFTRTGRTARAIARFRPQVPITAITPSEETRRRCALVWGVEALLLNGMAPADELGDVVERVVVSHGLADEGDTVLIAAGMPWAVESRTNLLKLHRIGERAEP